MGVLDMIFNVTFDRPYANTSLNCYDCDPFFMYSKGAQANLLSDLADPNVGNFFWYGHAEHLSFGAAKNTDKQPDLSSISIYDLEPVLSNTWTRAHKRLLAHHPFRLVVLEGCETAVDSQLAEAFGILGGVHSKYWFQRRGCPSQAYVGWTVDIYVPNCPAFDAVFANHGLHQQDMFGLWMSEVPLVQCVVAGATPYLNIFGVPVPDDTPLDLNWKIFGDPNLTRTPSSEP